MKTKIIMFGMIAMLAMAMFASSLVLAEDNATDKCFGSTDGVSKCGSNTSEVSEVKSGTIFWKEVGLWFTFNQEKKMEKEMQLAQMRLQQAEYATQNNNTKMAEKALDSYEKIMKKVSIRSGALDESSNISLGALKLAAMEQAILVHENKIQKLTSYMETANLTDEQKQKLEIKISRAENVTLHLEQVQSDKEEKVKTRLMAQGNLTEVEAESVIENAKSSVSEMNANAKAEWKEIKEHAEESNMTPAQYVKHNKQEIKSSISEKSGSLNSKEKN